MVDINLFKDEDEEKWESDSGDEEKSESGDELIDEFQMDEDLSQTSALSDKDLLDSDEPIPDFEESDDNELEDDYQFGDIKEKKTSPGIWIALGIVVVFAAVYFLWWQPKQAQSVRVTSTVVPRVPSNENQGLLPQEQMTDSTESVSDSSSLASSSSPGEGTISGETEIAGRISTSDDVASVNVVVDAGVAVFNNLAQGGQLGTIIIEGYQFHVGYVSETAGVAQAMGQRIQTVLGASGFEVSPEDQHRTAGKVHYWGVVSGIIPKKVSTTTQSAMGRQFATTDQFIQEINMLAQNNRLSVQKTDKFSPRFENGVNQTPVRITVEGSKAQTLAFFNALKALQGNYRLMKLTIAPVDISDFQANQVKLVLEFALIV